MSSQLNEADVARRATPLLKAFFKEHQSLQGPLLDEAFSGYVKDPRGLIKTDVEPDTFAVDCVGKLLAYCCTDGHRHSLTFAELTAKLDIPQPALYSWLRKGQLNARPVLAPAGTLWVIKADESELARLHQLHQAPRTWPQQVA